MGGGGGKGNLKTAALVLKDTSYSSLTCINVVIFVGVGKMNVKPRFSLQVPPYICYMYIYICINVLLLFYIYIVR